MAAISISWDSYVSASLIAVFACRPLNYEQQSYPVRAVHGWTKQSLLPIFGAESLNAVLMSGTDIQSCEDSSQNTQTKTSH